MAKAMSNEEIEAGLKKILWQHGQQQAGGSGNPSKSAGQKKKNRRNKNLKKKREDEDEVQSTTDVKRPTRPPGKNGSQSGQSGKGKGAKGQHSNGSTVQNVQGLSLVQVYNEPSSDTPRKRPKGKKSETVRRAGQNSEKQTDAGTGDNQQNKNSAKKKPDKRKQGKLEKKNVKEKDAKDNKTGVDPLSGKKTVSSTPENSRLLRHVPPPLGSEPKPSDEDLRELEKDFLFPLRKRSTKFPMAKYFCRLCEYHCDTVAICKKHMKDTRHLRLKVIRTTDIMLRNLPEPSKAHAAALTCLVDNIYKEHALSEEDFNYRYQVADKLRQIVQDKIPGLEFTVYGSSASGFGLNSSDLNIDLTCNDAPKQLCEIYMLLKNDTSGCFQNVRSDFSAKVPSVLFMETSSGLRCQLGVNSVAACQTTRLLGLYSKIDPRVRKLGVAFRYWAKLCKVDSQEAGTLPPFVFGLMTVYFLQQSKPPILPALHEIPPINGLTPEMAKVKKEDAYFDDLDRLHEVWKCNNKESIGALWVKMLRFYSVQFDITSFVISIRQQKMLSREQKKWASKKLAIEDPFAPKRNVARSVSHTHVFEYIYDRLRAAFRYYGIPQTKDGPLFQEVDATKLQNKLQQNLRKFSDSSEGSNEDSSSLRRRTLSENNKDVLQKLKDASSHRRTLSENVSSSKSKKKKVPTATLR